MSITKDEGEGVFAGLLHINVLRAQVKLELVILQQQQNYNQGIYIIYLYREIALRNSIIFPYSQGYFL